MNHTRRALLAALATGPVEGPALAADLGVSRAAVWKQVEALREVGFDIRSDGDGYVVRSVPEYGAESVLFGLDAPYDAEYHERIGSTNDRGRELAGRGAEDVVVLADEQTGGRGRLRRAWSSPSGGVWLSLVVRPERPPAHVPLFTLAAAVAVTRAAREAGVDARIKWPNDVLVSGANDDGVDRAVGTMPADRKLAGILTEMEGEADRVSWLVVGIGVNANVPRSALPAGATSLVVERGSPVERRVFVQRVVEEFHALREDPGSVLTAWREHAATLGRRVRVDTPGGGVEGEAVDVRHPGALVVATDDGEVTVHAGDCEHVRPL